MAKARAPISSRSLVRDERGSFQTEYTIVLVLVAIVVVGALATLGVPLVLYHRSVQAAVTAPVP